MKPPLFIIQMAILFLTNAVVLVCSYVMGWRQAPYGTGLLPFAIMIPLDILLMVLSDRFWRFMIEPRWPRS